MSLKECIYTPDAPEAVGPYSQAVAAGPILVTSGQIPLDPATGKLVEGGIREQTEQVLRNIEAVLAKAPDVITYVEHGVCDLGVVGKDTILERGGAFYEVLDLGFGRCRFALAVKEGTDFYGTYKTRRVASKYPAVTRAFFAEKGMDVDIIKIEGSVELAPILSLTDAIVDIVETGATLKANGLVPIETVAPVSARLIVNTASMKLHKSQINDFIDRCEAELERDI